MGMELTWSSASACRCFASRTFSRPLSVVSCSPLRRRLSCPTSQSLGLFFRKMRLQPYPLQALVSGTGELISDSNQGHISCTEDPTPITAGYKADAKEEYAEGGSVESVNNKIRVCDKLIEVFLVDKPTPTDWKRLIAFSREWSNIRPHFFERCQDRAEKEGDFQMKHKLLRLGRKLKEIDSDVQRHNELLEAIRDSPSEISEIVARRRKDFTEEFFFHVNIVAESYYDNPEEQNAVAKLGNDCLAAVQAYDAATESIKSLNAAELKLKDIINSPSVDAAYRKIDDLANKNQLDPALALLITKAWSAAKESDMTKTEAKDIMYHLYKAAVGSMQKLMPKEIRILKYLLSIKDPEEHICALKDAFTPGEELEGNDVDFLYTTPEQLCNWIKIISDAYHFSREGTLLREARDLLNPKTIQKLEELKKLIQDKFM
ncbi:hypothetical protein DM860_017047 [Cuscuta australis]|uniref:Uncharacterized protein n=1 Tax=Cuscuta australis TaxID=267555 RepID=A0A328DNE9_9ASTE|nr:hypothetical protein DM860_017047 [Cuscuta australis]